MAGSDGVAPTESVAIHRYTPSSFCLMFTNVIVIMLADASVAGSQLFVVLSNFSQEKFIVALVLLTASHDSEVLPISLMITELGCRVIVGRTKRNVR